MQIVKIIQYKKRDSDSILSQILYFLLFNNPITFYIPQVI